MLLDVCKITIGDHFYTAEHPLNPVERQTGIEFGKQVTQM